MLKEFKSITKSRNAVLLLLASATSTSGDWLYATGLSVVLYKLGSLKTLAFLTSFRFACMIFLMPIGGAIVENFSKKSIMIYSDLLRFLAMLLLSFEVFKSNSSLITITILSCFTSIVGVFFSPARRAILPQVVTEDKRNTLNALDGSIGTIILTIAPAMAGILLLKYSSGIIFLINALSFLISAIFLLFIKFKELNPEVNSKSNFSFNNWVAELIEGGSEILSNPFILIVTALAFSSHVAVGATWILIPAISNKLQLGDSSIGILSSFIGVGSIFGMIVGGKSNKKLHLEIAMLAVLLLALTLFCFSLNSIFLKISYVLMFLLGFFANVFEPICWTILQNKTPIKKYSRVFSTFDAIALIGMLIGTNVTAFFIEKNGFNFGVLVNSLTMIFLVFSCILIYKKNNKLRNYEL